MKGAVHAPGLGGRFPFAVDAAEAPRPGDIAGFRVHNLERIFSAQCLVYRLLQVTRESQRFQHHPIQAEDFNFAVPGVVEIDSHRFRAGSKDYLRAKQANNAEENCDSLHEFVLIRQMVDSSCIGEPSKNRLRRNGNMSMPTSVPVNMAASALPAPGPIPNP